MTELSLLNSNVLRSMEKFAIDMLNGIFFSNVISWDGFDQFNALPILRSEDAQGVRTEQRGCVFINKSRPMALRVLVSAYCSSQQQVCYRIKPLHKKIETGVQPAILYPAEYLNLDLSLADLQLGFVQDSAYVFHFNIVVPPKEQLALVSNLLMFLLNSYPVVIDEAKIFADLVDDFRSMPPTPGEEHCTPIYGVSNDS